MIHVEAELPDGSTLKFEASLTALQAYRKHQQNNVFWWQDMLAKHGETMDVLGVAVHCQSELDRSLHILSAIDAALEHHYSN